MRVKEFLELYVDDDTYIQLITIQDPEYAFEGTCAEFKALPEEDDSDAIGWLWVSNIFAADDTLVINISY